MVKAKGEHNSELWLKQRESITHNSNIFGGPMQFELSKFHCICEQMASKEHRVLKGMYSNVCNS